MKNKLLFLSSFILALFVSSKSLAQISTVPSVDVAKYLGTWYQISHNPLKFEGECACSIQKLATTAASGQVSVVNSCNDKTPSGPLRSISGTATSDDPVSNSKFSVDFGFPRKGEYWIIGLAADYSYAVVTDSRGDSLYILSKTPTLDPVLYQEALTKAQTQVDLSKLEITNQTGCVYP